MSRDVCDDGVAPRKKVFTRAAPMPCEAPVTITVFGSFGIEELLCICFYKLFDRAVVPLRCRYGIRLLWNIALRLVGHDFDPSRWKRQLLVEKLHRFLCY